MVVVAASSKGGLRAELHRIVLLLVWPSSRASQNHNAQIAFFRCGIIYYIYLPAQERNTATGHL